MSRFKKADAPTEQAPAEQTGQAEQTEETPGEAPPEQVAAPAAEAAPEAPPPKRYRVAGALPVVVQVANCPTTMRPGKILDERHFNIERLRAQGLQLEEIPYEAPAKKRTTGAWW